MDFSPEEEDFRKAVRDFIESELPEWWSSIWTGPEERWEFTRQLCDKLGERGWLTMAWPKEYGGENASVWKQTVIREEMIAAGEPRGPQYMSLNWIGPSIMIYGTEEQKKKFLPAVARGEINWCQGYSEPGAGSDLAALQTRAVEDGDYYIINGQKTWTSYATVADYCYLLARTDPDAPKHRGISVFLVDMKTTGVTTKQMRDIAGVVGDTCDTFFDDVRVHKSCMLGERNKGWYVAMAAANFERTGIARYYEAQRYVEQLVEYAKETKRNGQPLWKGPIIRQKLAEFYIRSRVARLLNYRVRSMEHAGQIPAVEMSLARLHNVLLIRDLGQESLEITGLYGTLKLGSKHEILKGKVVREAIVHRCITLAAGTVEVQKNVIARRGLGLPRSY